MIDRTMQAELHQGTGKGSADPQPNGACLAVPAITHCLLEKRKYQTKLSLKPSNLKAYMLDDACLPLTATPTHSIIITTQPGT